MSATMLCAHKAGIPVFVTGGIGGVHREGEKSKRLVRCLELPILDEFH